MINFETIKGPWVHIKTGARVDVVSMNTRDDKVGLRRESGRHSEKRIHYFIHEYKRPDGWNAERGK